MKKTLKGIILASLISTQVLTTPISALAETTGTTDTPTEAPAEEVTPTEPSEEKPAEAETSNTGDSSSNEAVEEDKKPEEEKPADSTTPSEKPEEEKPSEEKPSEEKPSEENKDAATEETKQFAAITIEKAKKTLDEGTYLGETTAPVRAAITVIEALLAKKDVTETELKAAVADLELKVRGLKMPEFLEVSFYQDLKRVVEEANLILNNEKYFKDIHTSASVKARKAKIEAAVKVGEALLASVLKPNKELNVPAVLANKDAMIAATNAILEAIHGNGTDEAGLIRRDHLADLLSEVQKLAGAQAATLQEKEAFEAAVAKALDAYENALTDDEIKTAVNDLRAALDKLQLAVTVSVVDENGTLLASESAITGTYKSVWTVTPPTIDGYEFVSTTNQTYTSVKSSLSGTYGDGTNKVTLVYKKVSGAPVPVPAPTNPGNAINQPVPLNTPIKNKSEKKNLPHTGEQSNAFASFGLVALAAGALAFFRKRKIEE